MTEEDVQNWRVERDIAKESGKPELLQKAYDHRDDLLMHCMQRQADRVKRLVANDERTEGEINIIKKDVCDIKQTVGQHDVIVQKVKSGTDKAVGMWLALKILAWVSATFGSGAVGWIIAITQKAQEATQ